MPKYRVHVEEVLNRDTYYEYEADSPEEAEDMLGLIAFDHEPIEVNEDGMHWEVLVTEIKENEDV